MKSAPTPLDRGLLWLGVAVCAVTIGLSVVAVWLRVTSGMPPLPNRFGMTDPALAGFAALEVACATVALAIVTRLPRNLVAWLLFGIGLGYAISIVAAALVYETAGAGGAITQPELAWLAQTAAQVPGVLTFVFVFVFPDIRAMSRRDRRLGVVFSVLIALGIVLIGLHPGPLFFWPQIENPVGISPLTILDPGGDLTSMAAGLAGMGALAVAWIGWRYYSSSGVERLQLKWFVSAAILNMVALAILVAIRGTALSPRTAEWPLLLFAITMTLVPIAVGIAILRYDLYAIDRLINRAIVYAAVTGLLAGVFAVVVVLVSGVLAGVTNEYQTVAVAISTLAVAGLFSPIRSRIQRAVDRRFYRSRYDTTLTVDEFSDRLRRTLDLAELEAAMLDVVERTLQPAATGVWLERTKTGSDSYRQAVRA